jgi:O-antigen/teichoic acid export membrane protein
VHYFHDERECAGALKVRKQIGYHIMSPVFSRVTTNVIANFGGRIWTGLMSFLFVPFYIRFLGIEAYGLIGFFASLMGLFVVLDMGLSTALNRELARLKGGAITPQHARDVTRTFEVFYWSIGLAIGGAVAGLAPVIAQSWIQSRGLPESTVRCAVMLMGGLIALRWPVPLYLGGLMGLQRQVFLNVVMASIATIQGLGAVLVLWLVMPSIEAFFAWQIICWAAQTALLAVFLWKRLPAAEYGPRVSRNALSAVWRFAAGMTAITALGTVLMQSDKILLSRLLDLEAFGRYSLAVAITGVIIALANPFFSALFPEFTRLAAEGDTASLSRIYHKGCQFLAVLVVPVCALVFTFSEPLLQFYVRDPILAHGTYRVLSLLMLGTALNSIMSLPLALQLAHGWTRLSVISNVIAVLLFVPLLVWLVILWGAEGAAVAWIALNVGYVLIQVPLMHRRLLRSEMWRWYSEDIGLPILVCGLVAALMAWLMPAFGGWKQIGWLAGTGILLFLAALVSAPAPRQWCKGILI